MQYLQAIHVCPVTLRYAHTLALQAQNLLPQYRSGGKKNLTLRLTAQRLLTSKHTKRSLLIPRHIGHISADGYPGHGLADQAALDISEQNHHLLRVL